MNRLYEVPTIEKIDYEFTEDVIAATCACQVSNACCPTNITYNYTIINNYYGSNNSLNYSSSRRRNRR